MKPNIDFSECLKDSPRFRQSLDDAETDLDLLEPKLEKLVKLCSNMIDAGKLFNNANGLFIGGVRDVAAHLKDDDLLSTTLERFTHVLSDLQRYNGILLDQAHRSICKNFNNFVRIDIRKIKETRKHFEKISDDMDSALIKNAQTSRSKPHEIEESESLLKAMHSCFYHTSLDYVFHINVLHSKKRFDILDTMLSYMHAQNAYFHQGSDLFEDHDPFIKQIASQINDLNVQAAIEKKEMEERHSLVQIKENQALLQHGSNTHINKAEDFIKEGYLFRRTTNAFKSLVRRWFTIQDHQLVYRKRSKDNLTVMEDDLRICTVKPIYEGDRRFCFEVVSPARCHVLQADSEEDCQAWIVAIHTAISRAFNRQSIQLTDSPIEDVSPSSVPTTDSLETSYNDNSIQSHTTQKSDADKKEKKPKSLKAFQKFVKSRGSSPTRPVALGEALQSLPSLKPVAMRTQSRLEKLLAIPGNDICCDCRSTQPRWASINLGIALCIECSGIHRSFGVHLSKVRSMTLDSWEPEMLKVMAELGNTVVNGIYEANVDETISLRATPQCPREIREKWIKAKYVQKAFVRKMPKPEDVEKDGTSSPAKRWSVCKKKRRSPGKTESPETITEAETPITDTSDTVQQGASQDSGLGGSALDVIVFGAGVNNEQEASQRTMVLDDSDSGSEAEDQDTTSTTSYEDFAKLHPDMLMYKAAQARNLPVMLDALAQQADVNWHSDDNDGKTPLIKAVESGSMAAVEFLLLNRAKVDVRDQRGRSPLHHATMLGNTGQVLQFIKRNANQHAVDEEGMNPLMIAVNNANADIVTLLRLAKLNEEMRETEGMYGTQGDETFNEVFRDFTRMANNSPEKLNRNK